MWGIDLPTDPDRPPSGVALGRHLASFPTPKIAHYCRRCGKQKSSQYELWRGADTTKKDHCDADGTGAEKEDGPKLCDEWTRFVVLRVCQSEPCQHGGKSHQPQ